MKSVLYLMSLIITTFTLSTCINANGAVSLHSAEDDPEILKANIIGVYMGSLPCVDCDAIRSVLRLNDDCSYELIYMYEGKSDEEFVKKGKWSIFENDLVLTELDYKYKIKPDLLIQLDLAGKMIQGDLAESYFMNRVK